MTFKTKEPSDEEVEELMRVTLASKNIELDALQFEKFRIACRKAIIENSDLKKPELIIAARVYLNFILQFPQLTF